MKTVLHRNFRNLHAYAARGETPPLEERLRYKFQSTEVTERCTLLVHPTLDHRWPTGLPRGRTVGSMAWERLGGKRSLYPFAPPTIPISDP